MNHFLDHDQNNLGEYVQLKTDICETAALVHSALQAEREPDEHYVQVNLSHAAVMAHASKLPSEITRSIAAIESIALEFRMASHATRPSVTVTVRDYLGNLAFAVKHENAPADADFSQALVYDDFHPAAIEDIPANGFNTLLAALIYPNKDGDYSQFSDADMFEEDTARSLIESLKRRFETHEEMEYRIPELGCIVQGASFNETLSRITVAYGVPRTDQAQHIEGPGVESSVFVEEGDPRIVIEKISDISDPKHAKPIRPDQGDLQLFKEVLGDILHRHEQPIPLSFDRMVAIQEAPEKVRRLGLKALDGSDLDQDGLDSPDTGA